MDVLQQQYPWISKEFFEKLLKNNYSDNRIHVKDYAIKAALQNGENYTTQMIRSTVTFVMDGEKRDRQIRLIIKAGLYNPQLKAAMDELRIFEHEIIVYTEVVPAVEKLLSDIGDYTKMSAKCFGTNIEQSYLVFDDLSADGYRNTDRRKGLDIAHYKLVLTKIAKYHAATAVLMTKNLKLFDEYQTPNVNENSVTWKSIFTNSMRTLAEYAQTQPNLQHLNKKLPKFADTIFLKCCEAWKRDDSEFNVLLHGDLWANNIMFAYRDSCIPSDAIMVDYQLGYIGSPGIDLSYTLFTSSNEDLRDKDWDFLLQHYHQVLKTTLLKLNYTKPIPTLTDIHCHFLRRGLSSVALAIIVYGARKLENVPEDNLSNFLNDTPDNRKYRLNMFLNLQHKKGLEFLLSYYDRKGYFD